jgi:phosphate-selective porin OprO/OprP
MAAPAQALADENDTTLRLYWKDGIRAETSDEQFKFKIGGRIMADWAWFDADDEIESVVGSQDDNDEFRRARLYIAGEIYKSVIFKAQYDFAGGDADFKDVYIGLKNLGPLGTVRAGHFYESVGLEELTSSKYITFMERSLTSALVPGRNSGFGFNATCADQRVTYAAGIFRDADDFGDSEDDNWQASFRTTGTPVANDDALVHLGFSYRHANPGGNELRLRARPEAHLADRWVDTEVMDIDETNTFGGELAAVVGPASFQAEYLHMITESGPTAGAIDDPDFSAFYLMGSFFFTGESRAYDAKKGVFGRVKPNENFGPDGGTGALEAAVRFSQIDLTDSGAEGGEQWDITGGLNWYLNPNTRVMLNYVHAVVENRAAGGIIDDANGDIVETRFQIDF